MAQGGNPHVRDPINRTRPPILLQMEAEAARLKLVAEEADAAVARLKEAEARRIKLPNGDFIVIPPSAQDGELLTFPDGRVYRLTESATAVVQLSD